jgi:hypothetical protein
MMANLDMNAHTQPPVIPNHIFPHLYLPLFLSTLLISISELGRLNTADPAACMLTNITDKGRLGLLATILFITTAITSSISIQANKAILLCVAQLMPRLLAQLVYLFVVHFNRSALFRSMFNFIIIRSFLVILIDSAVTALYIAAGFLDHSTHVDDTQDECWIQQVTESRDLFLNFLVKEISS